jgi:hypothetical protein
MRWLNIVGLVLNVIAAILLAFWPPRVQIYTEKGESPINFVGSPTFEGKRKATRQTWLFRLGPCFLGTGFFLQLIAAWNG